MPQSAQRTVPSSISRRSISGYQIVPAEVDTASCSVHVTTALNSRTTIRVSVPASRNSPLLAPHDVVPETGSVCVTQADAEAKLADEAEIALGCITIGTTVPIDMHDGSALMPFHVLLVASLPYTLTADQFSPILTHIDGSPLPMCKGDVVFNAVFYQPVGETGYCASSFGIRHGGRRVVKARDSRRGFRHGLRDVQMWSCLFL